MKGLYCKVGETAAEAKFVIQETNVPSALGSNQVKVQVKACALSPLDLKLHEDLKFQKDLVPVGREIVGIVLQVGPKVTFFQPDDEVVGKCYRNSALGYSDVWFVRYRHHQRESSCSEAREVEMGGGGRGHSGWTPGLYSPPYPSPYGIREHTAGAGWSQCSPLEFWPSS
uniref:Quinone oxidoreductase-like 1 n=1 Tax=Salmo salar TaxID=8030 RepID=B5X394_SALSA|nr:Quinone oxidoreductase-like 1 [Salmo salar]